MANRNLKFSLPNSINCISALNIRAKIDKAFPLLFV